MSIIMINNLIYVTTFSCLVLPCLVLSRPIHQQSTNDSRDHVPQFVFDIYTNISSSPKEESTEYNTIRSFENNQLGCTGDLYHFRFHISEIAPRELIKKATLRFHVEKNTSSTSSYITLFYSDSHTEKFLSTDQSSQWIEFEVGQYIMEWNRNTSSNRPTHIDFQIISNIGMNRVACDDQRLQLTINSDNQDLHPLLVVYSYDPNQELSDFVNTIERAAEEGIQDEDRTRRSTDPATVVTPTTQTNHCQKIDEAMDKVTFNKFLNPFGMELIGPASIPFHYCGGTCENTLSTTPTHASILSLHISEEDSEEKEKYCKYCVPIKYSDLHIIIKKISLTEILILKNSLVEDCGCIYSYSL